MRDMVTAGFANEVDEVKSTFFFVSDCGFKGFFAQPLVFRESNIKE